MGKSLTRYTNTLETLLQEVEDAIADRDLVAADVSRSGVGWHLDHLLKVCNGIYGLLVAADPAAYRRSANFWRSVVFLSGVIPRGRARAPKAVRPPEIIEVSALEAQLAQAREALASFSALDAKANYKHPVFGILDRDESVKFMVIHTRHHLKIVRDIRKQARPTSNV